MTVAQHDPLVPDEWWGSAKVRHAALWRGVEAQHVIATMQLADSVADQQILEQMIEESKPPLPAGSQGLHYLLAAPFRYTSPHASRFRRANAAGVWYGADTLHTSAAEIGYWRWRFQQDSAALGSRSIAVALTFYRADVRGASVDLTQAPWAQRGDAWGDPVDYSACQALADLAVSRRVQWMRYRSVRYASGQCAAVFDPAALRGIPHDEQTWHMLITAERVRLQRDRASLEFLVQEHCLVDA